VIKGDGGGDDDGEIYVEDVEEVVVVVVNGSKVPTSSGRITEGVGGVALGRSTFDDTKARLTTERVDLPWSRVNFLVAKASFCMIYCIIL
jgi:hypothetical protein